MVIFLIMASTGLYRWSGQVSHGSLCAGFDLWHSQGFEPLLLIFPIGFAVILANLPVAGMADQATSYHLIQAGLLPRCSRGLSSWVLAR